MKKIFFLYFYIIILLTILPRDAVSGDWPIYKGNIYFTGNNDEIIVKNNNLKWLFQAEERVLNPIESDGKIFFIDLKGSVYCLDEESGKLIWKIDLKELASQFKFLSKAPGKAKYPLIKGDILFLSDPTAIYAINKNSGTALWAKSAIRPNTSSDLSGRSPRVLVDGIYADPVIAGSNIFYGTRNTFISRAVESGNLKWENPSIKTYSGFPAFYGNLIFTQSMDYERDSYTVHCLMADSGREVWAQSIKKPIRIFPPVVYKDKVYIPSENTMNCLDLKTGGNIWIKAYEDIITSSPGFTDRSILFTTANKDITIINPDNGDIIKTITGPPQSGPNFVTVGDQIYIAYNEFESISEKKVAYGILKALSFTGDNPLWTYRTPFPGAVSQPAASKGIMFLPAGNYLYAVGTEYYPRIVEGGSGHAVIPGQEESPEGKTIPEKPVLSVPERKKIKTRKLHIAITDKDNTEIPADVEIKKREKDRIIYFEKKHMDKNGMIDVPEGDGAELLAAADNYIPKKEIVAGSDREKHIILDKIEKGRAYTVENILFEVDQAYLKKESIDILDKLIKLMKDNPGLQVEIRGHTDSTGSKEYNQKLSERRADAVVEYMVKNGISPERLGSAGYGMTKPVASNDTEEGRSRNRRTEFFIKR